MKILFCGGGTMGPVTPLLAVMRKLREMQPDLNFIWAGTPDGPERQVIKEEGIVFFEIPVAKFPRYLSLDWFTWPVKYLKAKNASRIIIYNQKPDLVVSAGGFTGVPVIKIASKAGIPCAIHQLDYWPGLSNKVVAGLCDLVTTSFPYETLPFFGIKSQRVPTPNRFAKVQHPARDHAIKNFALDNKRPITFIVGGGTGAMALNEAIWSVIDELLKKTQIIHMTGRGKRKNITKQGYVCQEFFNESELLNAYMAADLVVSRAGMGGIADLAALSKPAIFVPIPESHQENNLSRLPIEIVEQKKDFTKQLLSKIYEMLKDEDHRNLCGKRLHDEFLTDDGSCLAQKWLELLLKKGSEL